MPGVQTNTGDLDLRIWFECCFLGPIDQFLRAAVHLPNSRAKEILCPHGICSQWIYGSFNTVTVSKQVGVIKIYWLILARKWLPIMVGTESKESAMTQKEHLLSQICTLIQLIVLLQTCSSLCSSSSCTLYMIISWCTYCTTLPPICLFLSNCNIINDCCTHQLQWYDPELIYINTLLDPSVAKCVWSQALSNWVEVMLISYNG